jgi:hypothetical protein
MLLECLLLNVGVAKKKHSTILSKGDFPDISIHHAVFRFRLTYFEG